jgi:molecular chaperone HscB
VNEAYRTLSDPVARAEYLLHVRGIDATDETDTKLPVAFLTRQLERREAADEAADAHDEAALAALSKDVADDAVRLRAEVERALDGDDLPAARSLVRELRFLAKLAEDLDALRAVELDG